MNKLIASIFLFSSVEGLAVTYTWDVSYRGIVDADWTAFTAGEEEGQFFSDPKFSCGVTKVDKTKDGEARFLACGTPGQESAMISVKCVGSHKDDRSLFFMSGERKWVFSVACKPGKKKNP